MTKTKNTTLRYAMLRAVMLPIVFVVMFASSYVVVSSLPSPVTDPETSTGVMDDRPNAKGSPVWFVEKFDCWNGNPPADMVGVIPGHVIVTVGNKTFRGGSKMVGIALADIFEDADTEIQSIHGFCR